MSREPSLPTLVSRKATEGEFRGQAIEFKEQVCVGVCVCEHVLRPDL